MSPEDLAEQLYGGKWKVTNPEIAFEEGRKQGALEELKRIYAMVESGEIDYTETCAEIVKRINELGGLKNE